jgi:hypothetical protein
MVFYLELNVNNNYVLDLIKIFKLKMTETEAEINNKLELLDLEMKELKKFKNKLIDIYLLEFEENFSDILILDKDKYLDRLGEKISLILSDKFSDRSFERDDFLNLLTNVEKIFLDNYYAVSLEFLKSKVKNLGDKKILNNNVIFPIVHRKSSYNKRSSTESIDRSNFL